MDEKPNYYAVIPAEVRYDNDLRANEKLLYGEITALAQKTGECWATNKYFSMLYDVQPNAIATWIRHLKQKEYIVVDYVYNGKEIDKRVIKIGGIQKDNTYSQKDTTPYLKRYEGIIQKGEENNTSINNTSIKKEIYKEKRFKKPSLEEVQDYCKERNNNINAEQFLDFYESNGWKVGKNPMKDWKAAVRTWERNSIRKETKYEETQRKIEEWLKDE